MSLSGFSRSPRPCGTFQSSMTALPSFVQLMATLGLENRAPEPEPPTEFANSSPSIVVSEHDSESDRHSGARRVTRYAPYSAPISHTRRRSSSSLSNEGNNPDRPGRSSSASPRPTARMHRPVALKLGAESRHRHAVSETEMTNMPISTLVRHKTPQSSPISPTFAHRSRHKKRSPSPKLPVSIPTLPPVFVQPSRSVSPDPEQSQREEDTHLTADYSEVRRHSISHEDNRRYIPPIS